MAACGSRRERNDVSRNFQFLAAVLWMIGNGKNRRVVGAQSQFEGLGAEPQCQFGGGPIQLEVAKGIAPCRRIVRPRQRP